MLLFKIIRDILIKFTVFVVFYYKFNLNNAD